MATLKMTRRYRVQLGAISGAQLILVGCGGTGSFLALHLARLAYDARERHGLALQITFVDPDRVEVGNLGRQNFCPAEVGTNKAQALAWRYSAAFGLPIQAYPRAFQPGDVPGWVSSQQPVVLVGAVDTTAARRVLHETCVARGDRVWWLDCGNHDQAGQVLLGCSEEAALRLHALGYCDRLPLPSVQCPELLVDAPQASVGSCAERVRRDEQSLMINQQVAGWAAVILHRLLVTRDLDWLATYLDLESGAARSVPIATGGCAAGRATPRLESVLQ